MAISDPLGMDSSDIFLTVFTKNKNIAWSAWISAPLEEWSMTIGSFGFIQT